MGRNRTARLQVANVAPIPSEANEHGQDILVDASAGLPASLADAHRALAALTLGTVSATGKLKQPTCKDRERADRLVRSAILPSVASYADVRSVVFGFELSTPEETARVARVVERAAIALRGDDGRAERVCTAASMSTARAMLRVLRIGGCVDTMVKGAKERAVAHRNIEEGAVRTWNETMDVSPFEKRKQ